MATNRYQSSKTNTDLFAPKQSNPTAPPVSQSRAVAPAANRAVSPFAQFLGTISNKLKDNKQAFESLLPRSYVGGADRFIATCYYYVKSNESLWECEPAMLLPEFIKVAQQGLDFGIPNECHVVAFNNSKKGIKEPVMIRGYKGDLKMARRSATVKFVDAYEVREKDTFEYEMGDCPRVHHHVPKFGEARGNIVGFYAVAKDHNGNVYLHVMTNADMWAHAKAFPPRAKAGPFGYMEQQGPSHKNWESYGLKTVIIRLCVKKLDLTSEMAQQFAEERAAMGEDEPRESTVAPVIVGDEFDITAPLTDHAEKLQSNTADELNGGGEPDETEEQRAERERQEWEMAQAGGPDEQV